MGSHAIPKWCHFSCLSVPAAKHCDSARHRFLEAIGVSDEETFVEHNFAPPSLRRNICVLGLLHKRVLGKAHPVFQDLLPFHADLFGELRPGEHNKQFYGHILDVHFQHALHSRSIFGMVYVHNRLHKTWLIRFPFEPFSAVS